MRGLIIYLSLFIAVPAFADGSDSTGEVNQETQAVLERVDAAGEWVSTTLGTLADKLGTTVEYLWPTFVKEVFVTGLVYVLCGVLSLIAGILFCLFLLQLRDKLNSSYQKSRVCGDWSDGACASQAFAFIFLLSGLILFISLSAVGLISVAAPEPEALKNISEAVRNLK